MQHHERGVEPRPGSRGFTLIELFVVLAVLGIAMALGIPAIHNLIIRSKSEGYAREASVLMQRARLEAIKMNREGVVHLDPGARQLVAFIDTDRDGTFNPDPGAPYRSADYVLGRLDLPANVEFRAPTGQPVVEGFTSVEVDSGTVDAAVFQPDGSAADAGAFRVGDVRDNFLEVRVEPAASGRVEVRKWHETHDGASLQKWLGAGDPADDDFKPWEWN